MECHLAEAALMDAGHASTQEGRCFLRLAPPKFQQSFPGKQPQGETRLPAKWGGRGTFQFLLRPLYGLYTICQAKWARAQGCAESSEDRPELFPALSGVVTNGQWNFTSVTLPAQIGVPSPI